MPTQSKKRFIAKKTAHVIVALNVAKKVKINVLNHTDIESDSIMLTVACMIVGETVALHTDPYTDAAVDKSANWLKSKKPSKKQDNITTESKEDTTSPSSE